MTVRPVRLPVSDSSMKNVLVFLIGLLSGYFWFALQGVK